MFKKKIISAVVISAALASSTALASTSSTQGSKGSSFGMFLEKQVNTHEPVYETDARFFNPQFKNFSKMYKKASTEEKSKISQMPPIHVTAEDFYANKDAQPRNYEGLDGKFFVVGKDGTYLQAIGGKLVGKVSVEINTINKIISEIDHRKLRETDALDNLQVNTSESTVEDLTDLFSQRPFTMNNIGYNKKIMGFNLDVVSFLKLKGVSFKKSNKKTEGKYIIALKQGRWTQYSIFQDSNMTKLVKGHGEQFSLQSTYFNQTLKETFPDLKVYNVSVKKDSWPSDGGLEMARELYPDAEL